jgi:hypothetical protein
LLGLDLLVQRVHHALVARLQCLLERLWCDDLYDQQTQREVFSLIQSKVSDGWGFEGNLTSWAWANCLRSSAMAARSTSSCLLWDSCTVYIACSEKKIRLNEANLDRGIAHYVPRAESPVYLACPP